MGRRKVEKLYKNERSKMIKNKQELKDVLEYEKTLYWGSGKEAKYQYLLAVLKDHPNYRVWKYNILLRKAGYYYFCRKKNMLKAILYFWYCRKKNRLGRKLGIELNERTFDKGLIIYHTQGIVVNGRAVVGKNCHLHGNNCIGTNGKTVDCPVLGDNVTLGVGAKVLGKVRIADGIKIAAGAVVVHSFEEKGITIGGIPARKLR